MSEKQITERIISELWEYLYNPYSVNGVLIISRQHFEDILELVKRRHQI